MSLKSEGALKISQIVFACLVVFWGLPLGGFATGKYAVSSKVVEGHATTHLLDTSRNMDFGLVPDIGNFGYEFKVNNKDVLIPPSSFKSYVESHKLGSGCPFLAPWANRIDHDYYYFDGKKYLLNDALGNLMRDQFNQVIHGLLVFDPRWEVVKTGASDADGAFVTSRLEFYKHPDLMAQFPFAHTIEVTYRLKGGKLENTTVISNIGRAAMPVLFAYHPYFRPDGNREQWTVSVGVKKHWLLSKQLIPTGETEPIQNYLPGAHNLTLGKTFLDGVFSDLERGPDGVGRIWVKGKTEKIEVVYDKEYDFAVVYAPLDNSLICIETQTGPTNAFNLNHEGKFPGLIVLKPGQVFKARFRIVPSGFWTPDSSEARSVTQRIRRVEAR